MKIDETRFRHFVGDHAESNFHAAVSKNQNKYKLQFFGETSEFVYKNRSVMLEVLADTDWPAASETRKSVSCTVESFWRHMMGCGVSTRRRLEQWRWSVRWYCARHCIREADPAVARQRWRRSAPQRFLQRLSRVRVQAHARDLAKSGS